MAVLAAKQSGIPRKKGRISRREVRRVLLGLLFISPWLIGFLGFTLYPLGSSIWYSLTRFDLIRKPVFIGLGNFSEIFANDEEFKTVMYNTLYYVGLGAPLSVITAFLLAFLLNLQIKARSVWRAIFFFPAIVPAVVIAMVMAFLLNTQFGAINSTLQALGWPVIHFLSSPELAKPSLIGINMWASGTAMVIFLATLQDVPREYYEAAIVDGANAWHKFWFITIPLCTPIIMYNLVMALIWGFQDFTMPMLLTQGGPNQATEFYALFLYNNAFHYLRMGKACALAWILFAIIVIFTLIVFRTSDKWVFYGGGED
jgi:multiple sugar transport system permease protein